MEIDCKGSSYLMASSIVLHGVTMMCVVETIISKSKRYNRTHIKGYENPQDLNIRLGTRYINTTLFKNTCFASMHDICIDLLIFLINR
jgi:hypothetical protein